MSKERCSSCRFWLVDTHSATNDDNRPAFGRCRRDPPRIIDALLAPQIPSAAHGRNRTEIDHFVDWSQIDAATEWPVTFFTSWCGRFEPAPSTDPHMALLAERNALIDYLNSHARSDAEAEVDDGADRLNAADNRILETPATTKDGVFAKMLLATQLITEGHDICGEQAAALICEASLVTRVGRVSPNVAMLREA